MKTCLEKINILSFLPNYNADKFYQEPNFLNIDQIHVKNHRQLHTKGFVMKYTFVWYVSDIVNV